MLMRLESWASIIFSILGKEFLDLSGRRQRGQMFLPPVADNHTCNSSANATASVCLYRKQVRPLRCWLIIRPRLTAGLWISRTWRPEAGRRPCPPVVLHICVLTHVPWRGRPGRSLPAVSPAHLPAMSTVQRHPTGAGCDSPARCPGANRPLRSLQPPPWLFCNVSGMPPPAMSIDQWVPVPGTVSGTSLRSPSLPLRVKGTYSGEIESLSRDPGIATLDSGMRFIGN